MRDYRLYLDDIVTAAKKIENYSKGLTLQGLKKKSLVIDGIARNLEIIGEEGQLAYSQTNDEFYHSNGSAWVAQGGGTAVLTLSCAWGVDYQTNEDTVWNTSCTPPGCPSGWASVATYSEPLSVACPGYNSACMWAATGLNVSLHPVAVGRSVRVCVK